jgi:HD superfamily phosphodiesterase
MKLIDLAKKLYHGRDSSHGIAHVTKVRENALLISKKLNINDTMTLVKIEASALFHDLWDHKYIVPSSEEHALIKHYFWKELKKKLFSDHDIKDIEIIINNISLSREIYFKKNNQSINLKHLQLIRDIVSDADKLEMLGISGIDRIVEHEMHKYPNTKADKLKEVVMKVYSEKISKLLSENYIKTEPARELAVPLMVEMDTYIKMIK